MTMKLLEFEYRRKNQFVESWEASEAIGQEAHEPVVDIADAPPAALVRRQQKSLLLVSDDAALGVSLGNAADLADLTFHQVTDPGPALWLAALERPAAVFLDLDMPGLDIWRAAEHFLFEAKGPPVVFLTGRTGHFDLGVAVRAGMVLDKSLRAGELVEKLDRFLKRNAREEENYRARQRLMVRWLRPFDWMEAKAPAIRDWGIND